ncbi:uncharacterized protein LOC108272267 isoform X1 [Ictalurus punctatus]|uniref:Uncharacterized protein LOC108272267 isoform X1 n=1 Tax=Ictalurus punctatus TaxID=7998 RepID=A0A2D0RZY8_ICTPU|nr:uncharacterized protein LOC108272267 isoform X1 [Ictalurus punctatus]
MAVRCTNKLHYSFLFVFVLVCVLFGKSASSLTSDKPGHGEFKHFRSFRSVSEPTAPPPGVRLHPGVVASVVIVATAAIVAAFFIIRKYCFPQSDATYRYSVLRRMEEQREEESDEDLLE